ncbi:MAG: endolytic transglycosylase MltG [Gammaproteobacteria bacterium]|nr:endolytic transglycosylase MltG [Gammaproteobacteria bacterium]
MHNPLDAQPPRPPQSLGDKLFKLAGILVICISVVLGWLGYDYQSFTQTPLNVPADGLVIEIQPGRSVRGIAEDLATKQIIASPLYFEWMARVSGAAPRLQAGEYRIEPGTLPETFIQFLAAGKVVQHSLTIIEGWTFTQLMAAVQTHPVLLHTLHDKSAPQIMVALDHPGEHPEGRFLPDTYKFPRGMTDAEFLGRAYAGMQETLQREWATRAKDLPFETPYEALILASIVEKETGVATERPRIAGVFIRRLKQGMRLQTDPTVIYGMGKAFDGDIRVSDLRKDTPYNTYTRDGLPPTPIALPGADAIRAVLHPADGKELFFVSKGDGSHYFSATLEDHNRAVQEYQLKR